MSIILNRQPERCTLYTIKTRLILLSYRSRMKGDIISRNRLRKASDLNLLMSKRTFLSILDVRFHLLMNSFQYSHRAQKFISLVLIQSTRSLLLPLLVMLDGRQRGHTVRKVSRRGGLRRRINWSERSCGCLCS